MQECCPQSRIRLETVSARADPLQENTNGGEYIIAQALRQVNSIQGIHVESKIREEVITVVVIGLKKRMADALTCSAKIPRTWMMNTLKKEKDMNGTFSYLCCSRCSCHPAG